MSTDRDIGTFSRRAGTYDSGWLGYWHGHLVARANDLVRSLHLSPSAVLDVGCGTGRLLRLLSAGDPVGERRVGLDPAPGMIEAAQMSIGAETDLAQASAERLPFSGGAFDLVVSTVSFDHWGDQAAGLAECARVLRPGGTFVLIDLFARWLGVTTVRGRRDRTRTPRGAERLLRAAGLEPRRWARLEGLGPVSVIQAVIAERPSV